MQQIACTLYMHSHTVSTHLLCQASSIFFPSPLELHDARLEGGVVRTKDSIP